jgi:hypothetical protein
MDVETNLDSRSYLGRVLGNFDYFLYDQQVPACNQEEMEDVR